MIKIMNFIEGEKKKLGRGGNVIKRWRRKDQRSRRYTQNVKAKRRN